MNINAWSICFANELRNNPHYRNPSTLEAIVRLGDYNEKQFDREKGFADNIPGWDEWRLFAWMEAVERAADSMDAPRLARWRDIFILFGEHIIKMCVDMEHFDGAIPNHGIWNHALLYRIGQRYGRSDFRDMAGLAFERILAAQTPDGCFLEGGTSAGFPGSPVVMYNTVSCMAVNMYLGYSGDPAAEKALEKGFRWWWNTRFPDFTDMNVLDCRNRSYAQSFGQDGPEIHPLILPAYFFNKPEVRGYAEQGWRLRRDKPFTDARKSPHTGPYYSQGLGFISLQWDNIKESVETAEPEWPELTRFIALEAGVRRRNGWHAALSGISNACASSWTLPTWRLERQCLLEIWNERCGKIIGSGNSLIQEDASTMTFYENGCAHYLHTGAYFKSTTLDTLHLHYGVNTGAVSVDTSDASFCRVIFSMLGETGKRAERGVGHPASAMAARGRIALAPAAGGAIRRGETKHELAQDSGLLWRIAAGEEINCGAWSILCENAWWDLRWPVGLSNAYKPLYPDETIGIAEVALWTSATTYEPRPTAVFVIKLK
jgi:hypothetical protein